jgi:type IV pilus assembly protein PilO
MSIKDPRIAMRVVIGALLAANLAMAVVAFKPFGGSADDLRKDQARLSAQLRQLQTNLEKSKQHVAKIEIARSEGDDFMAKYIMDKRSAPATMVEELSKAANDAGVRVLPDTFSYETLEGSDTLQMLSIAAPFEGDYAGLAKLVNLLEKSPRFWIIDEMSLNAPQQQNQKVAAAQQNLNVNLKLLAFVRDDSGAVE